MQKGMYAALAAAMMGAVWMPVAGAQAPAASEPAPAAEAPTAPEAAKAPEPAKAPAASKAPGAGPNPFSDCGIGAALFPKTGWAAVTSNVIWDIGTTALTSA